MMVIYLRRISVFICAIIVNSSLSAQGIRFEENISLTALLQKARQENKFVLIDCHATWCAPCKQMDREVFTDKTVGAFTKEYYLAAKFQLDSTSKDSDGLKMLYADAAALKRQYSINSLPTILFLSPEGKLVYRTGFQLSKDFIESLRLSVNNNENMSGLMSRFNSRKLKEPEYLKLITLFNRAGMKDSALKVAWHYNKQILNKMKEDDLLGKRYLQFFIEQYNIFSTSDRLFDIYNKKSTIVDSIMNRKGVARNMADFIITKDFIYQYTMDSESKPRKMKPDWNRYHLAIKNKYGANRADMLVTNAKYIWYYNTGDWEQTAENLLLKIGYEGIPEGGVALEQLNAGIYKVILEKSKVKGHTIVAIEWMEEILAKNPENYRWIDTYASLLYKNRSCAEAINQEEKALEIARKKGDKESVQFYEEILQKMRKCEVIW